MKLEIFDGVIAGFVISKLAGGEILESYVKNEDILQSLLEVSLNYIEFYPTLRDSINNNNNELVFVNLVFTNIKVSLAEVKKDDIYIVLFFDNSYADGIIKIIFSDYLEYIKNNYLF